MHQLHCLHWGVALTATLRLNQWNLSLCKSGVLKAMSYFHHEWAWKNQCLNWILSGKLFNVDLGFQFMSPVQGRWCETLELLCCWAVHDWAPRTLLWTFMVQRQEMWLTKCQQLSLLVIIKICNSYYLSPIFLFFLLLSYWVKHGKLITGWSMAFYYQKRKEKDFQLEDQKFVAFLFLCWKHFTSLY